VLNVPLLDSIASSALTRLSSTGPSQGISNTAWSFAKFAYTDGPLLTAISAAARPNMSDFDPQGLANLAWAFATLSC